LIGSGRSVSAKKLMHACGETVRPVPCTAQKAESLSGYLTGAISPFLTRVEFDIYLDQRAGEKERVYVSAGRRGFAASLEIADLVWLLRPEVADLGVD
jgi:Cys-tRNA(Pro)/Cys-tRNA(Cys) deacylase